MNESKDFHPKDFVSSVVPKRRELVSTSLGRCRVLTDWLAGCLEVVEYTLQGQCQALGWNVFICGNLIHGLRGVSIGHSSCLISSDALCGNSLCRIMIGVESSYSMSRPDS